ncbi:hypothetical protein OUZ56_006630 [Daphnia magna]|uniref:Uncharacterized protein n=1 Tax=Daphnia magna TaxID=35525 RepID=A0ABQ9YW77_9CRUS|nr:hypothetical protein OUZ56_006630 [Daphnia magna]
MTKTRDKEKFNNFLFFSGYDWACYYAASCSLLLITTVLQVQSLSIKELVDEADGLIGATAVFLLNFSQFIRMFSYYGTQMCFPFVMRVFCVMTSSSSRQPVGLNGQRKNRVAHRGRAPTRTDLTREHFEMKGDR